jgi:two-component sensor histidine kinase
VRWIEGRAFVVYRSDGSPQRVAGVNIDVTERKRAEEQLRALNAELDHRVKNVLATVSAVAAHTLDTSGSVNDFACALDGRLRSMASTHELLSHRAWRGLPLAELLRGELAPYATSDNTEISGPEVTLSAEAGQAVAMVLHELTTNAAKYGALSGREGRVSVRWYWPTNGNAPDRLVLEWRETGGPSIPVPSRSGYGTSVIRDLVPYELGGTADLEFAPEGLRCRLGIPLRWIDEAAMARVSGSHAICES